MVIPILMVLANLACGAGPPAGSGEVVLSGSDAYEVLRARIALKTDRILAGGPVVLEFLLENTSNLPVELTVPGKSEQSGRQDCLMSLSIGHIFSGPGSRAMQIFDLFTPRRSELAARGLSADNSTTKPASRAAKPAPVDLGADVTMAGGPAGSSILIGPNGLAGVQLDLSKYYPAVHVPGRYSLRWRPYGGALQSNRLEIQVLGRPVAVIQSNLGSMRIELLDQKAPRQVANFIELVESGFYDTVPGSGKLMTFHRVVPGFLIQGGSPDDTSAGKSARAVPAEFNDLRHRLGMVGAARSVDDPDSASSQFYICLGDLPQLDYRWTLFGRLIGQQSYEVLARISRVQLTNDRTSGEQSRPKKPVVIQRIYLAGQGQSDN